MISGVATDILASLPEVFDMLVVRKEMGIPTPTQVVLQQELDLFATLRDGSALLEHLEDFYLVTLQRSAAARPAPRGPGRIGAPGRGPPPPSTPSPPAAAELLGPPPAGSSRGLRPVKKRIRE